MSKRQINLGTWNHLGDTLLLGAAIRNLEKSAHGGEFEIWHNSRFCDLFCGWDYVHIGNGAIEEKRFGYLGGGVAERVAASGTLAEGFTRQLAELLRVDIPFTERTMPIFMNPSEPRKFAHLAGCVVMNSNCQQCSMTKRYPHWQAVATMLEPHAVVLIGGGEGRDVLQNVTGRNVVDLRGRTSVRDLIALVSICAGVVSPPSGVVHLAAALGRPAVYLTGARENAALFGYDKCQPITTTCQGTRYNGRHGCNHMYSCEGQMEIDGQKYPQCLAKIRAAEVVAEARRLFWGEANGD